MDWMTIVNLVIGAINAGFVIYAGWKKLKPEVKKLETENEADNVETANINLEGARLSAEILKGRIDELRQDLENEKRARKDDIEYFKRRVKEIDRELRDYRMWAARLAKQVIESGKEPVPFISSLSESDPLMMSITKEQVELEKAKQKRQEELKNASSDKQEPKGR